jgi:hypothetical protein
VVPDLPDEQAGRTKPSARRTHSAPLSLVGDPGTAPQSGVMTVPPPGTTADDLRRHLAESGAPQPFLDHAETFGADVDLLFEWLRDYGPVFSERQWAADVLDHWTRFLEPGVAGIEAERFGAAFLAMYEEDSIGMIRHLIAEAAESLRPEAVALARTLASIGPAPIRSAAKSSAQALVAAGVRDVSWAGDLGSGEWVAAEGFADPGQSEETLVMQFMIAGTLHGFSLLLDHRRGGGLKDAQLVTDVGQLHRQMEIRAAVSGLTLGPRTRAEAGRILSAALAAPLATLDPQQIERITALVPLLRSREHLVIVPADVVALDPPAFTTTSVRRLGKIHRIKVTLDRTKPAVWRRLEVPSGTTLAQLHRIIQAAFAWSGAHLWVFETSRGEYGDSDADMGFGDAAGLTLAMVAPTSGAKFFYLYDFGDDWRHSIVVEKVSAAGDVNYPRCTGGRRSGPLEDCGGPVIYSEIISALSGRDSSTHRAILDAMPLVPPEGFDPAAFSARQVDETLGPL